ncbi:hypothetical protein [Burkholderia multivorans]|uniref:hypothetical protein n=1 Tax=Burkholderia multivorans TaxID=87883 RepID=UPI0020B41118|nr:hypothetical protein [Burkholderia multivorans]
MNAGKKKRKCPGQHKSQTSGGIVFVNIVQITESDVKSPPPPKKTLNVPWLDPSPITNWLAGRKEVVIKHGEIDFHFNNPPHLATLSQASPRFDEPPPASKAFSVHQISGHSALHITLSRHQDNCVIHIRCARSLPAFTSLINLVLKRSMLARRAIFQEYQSLTSSQSSNAGTPIYWDAREIRVNHIFNNIDIGSPLSCFSVRCV